MTELSKNLEARLKKHVRDEVGIKKRCDREINAACEKYRSSIEAEKRAGNNPVTVIAEGDSWGRYAAGHGVVFYLEKLLRTEILNLAHSGDELREMLSIKQKQRLAKELKRGPARGKKYDFMFFSGGGNDLVGADRFHKWLHTYERGMSAEDVLNRSTIKAVFVLMEIGYKELIAIRDSNSPNTHLLLHGYDFAIPNGQGVCGKGPWLEPGLAMRKVPRAMRKAVVRLFLEEFDGLLDKLARGSQHITVVQTQGTLREDEWANELHPTNSGFKKIAQCFKEVIENVRHTVD